MINLNVIILCSIFICSCNNILNTNTDELVAEAGPDQTTIAGSYAIFDPTKSIGDYNWYEWQQDISNPDVVKIFSESIANNIESNIHKVGFVKEGIYKFKLIVREGVTAGNMNGTNSSKSDEFQITVTPNPNSRFEDSNLEITLRVALGRQIEDLNDNYLLFLDSLQCVLSPQLISSLKGLEGCINLVYLNMSLQDITDITPLSSLRKIKVLGLDQNRKINSISSLKDLTEIEWLNLDSNMLTDISPIEKLVKLKYLSLQYNSIISITVLKNMKDLKELWISDAPISDLSSLSDLNRLEILWLNKCDIEDISYLKNLTNVKTLKLAWNRIVDISSFSNMEKLEWVALEKNNISDISPLKDLPNLGYVRLWDNEISDIKPLVDNPNIGKGDIVGLDGNPLNEKSITEYIPTLKARGVSVTW